MKKIRIYGKQVSTKDGTRKFTVYDCVGASGTWYRVKFTNSCPNKPTMTGYGILEVDPADLFVTSKSVVTSQGEEKVVKTLWVRNVLSCSVDEERNEQALKRKQEQIADVLSD